MVPEHPSAQAREAGDGSGGTVVPTTPQYTTEQYRAINSWDDAMALAQASFGQLVTAEDLGDGFQLVKEEDKAALVGVPMLCLYAQLRTGDLGGYVVVRCITKDGRKVVVVDGGTGMYEQLNTYMQEHAGRWPNVWPRGLRRSDYKKELPHPKEPGKTIIADSTTFYIDTSAA